MNKKKLVSLGIAAIFLTLGTTGLLLYLIAHNKPTKVIHTTFGLFFVAIAVFHIINNWGSLVSYLKGKEAAGLGKEFVIVAVLATVSVIGAGLLLPPFEQIEEFGEELRKGNKAPVKKVSYQIIETNIESGGRSVNLQLDKDKSALLPVVAVWTTDSTGQFIDNIFAPSKMTIVFAGEEGNEEHAIREGEIEDKDLSAEVIPAWHATGSASNVTETTPNDPMMIRSFTKASGSFTVNVEISSMGNTEFYQATINDAGKISRLSAVRGEGKLLSGFVITD
ncbi:MAG: hypothetical protein ACO3FI_07805 [Cyclobacteriaceae bacterium]